MLKNKKIVKSAVKDADGVAAVAKFFDFGSHTSVYKWIDADRVPAIRVIAFIDFIKKTSGKVYQPHELNPDVFPEPEKAA